MMTRTSTIPNDVMQACPRCGGIITEEGDQGIRDWEDRWEVQATRYRCNSGHLIFVVDAERIDDAEDGTANA